MDDFTCVTPGCNNIGMSQGPNRKRAKKCWGCQTSPEAKKRNARRAAKRAQENRRPYRTHVEEQCSRCGFVPEDICQLDVDHIDGDHSNNNPENLQTLCANCHRLKTALERRGT